MPRSPRRARLAPGFHLEQIIIKIPLGGVPVAELSGRALTGNPRIDAMSRVSVVTTALPACGQQLIAEMEDRFSGQAPAPASSPKTKPTLA